jgi:ATP-dependent DNA helicase RecG
MKIVDGPREHLWPRNVGLLFFNDAPEHFFPQVQIDVVELPEGAGGDRIIERTFTGPLGWQLRNALAYLRDSIIFEEVRKRPDRAEADRFFNYPYAALEESLVNAVYHRSYEVREPIEVRVLPDHITITSFPGPDRSISIAELEAGSFVARRYRNRRIGEFLKELKLTEGRGTGVPKIIRAMRANGSPPPRFQTDEDRTYFATILPVHPLLVPQPDQVDEQVGQVADRVSRAAGEQVLRDLGELGFRVLALCSKARSRGEIEHHLGREWSGKRVRSVVLRPLLDAGLLEMTQPESPRSPTQRYKTTGIGQLILNNFSLPSKNK